MNLDIEIPQGIRFGWIDPHAAQDHPLNWREHPVEQADALDAVLNDVGWAGATILNDRRVEDGWLVSTAPKDGSAQHECLNGSDCLHAVPTILDGHLRKEHSLKRGTKVLAIIGHWTPTQEKIILASHDSITGMATTNHARFLALLEMTKSANPQTNELLESLKAKAQEQLNALLEQQEKRSDGSILELAQVTIADPKHQCAPHDVWRIGEHVLIVADVFREWRVWSAFFNDERADELFLPFAGPFAALTDTAKEHSLVMVQPDPYIAGHILDRFAEVYGNQAIERAENIV